MKKRGIALLLVFCMLTASNISAFAQTPAGYQTRFSDFIYVVQNSDGNTIQEGYTQEKAPRYSGWAPQILRNGNTATYKNRQSSSGGFVVMQGATMTIQYYCSRWDATIKCTIYKNGKAWNTTTHIGSSLSFPIRADEEAEYYFSLTNMSSDSVEISRVAILF